MHENTSSSPELNIHSSVEPPYTRQDLRPRTLVSHVSLVESVVENVDDENVDENVDEKRCWENL